MSFETPIPIPDASELRLALAHPVARDPSAQRALEVAPLEGAPGLRQRGPGRDGHRVAAVLGVVVPGDAGPQLLLTRRAEALEEHAGQISLPGGSPEAGDVSLAHTALRETEEELGIAPSTLELVGELARVYIPATRFLVTPFVALAAEPPRLRVASAEVAEVLELPLASLLAPEAVERERRMLGGRLYLVPFYRLRGDRIWGATARILAQLAAALHAVREPAR